MSVNAQTVTSAEIKSQIASQLENIYKKNTNADVELTKQFLDSIPVARAYDFLNKLRELERRRRGRERREMNKYRNCPMVLDGIAFDSKREAERYSELRILLKAGLIKDLVLQPAFELQGKFRCRGKNYPAVTYRADFQYTECCG